MPPQELALAPDDALLKPATVLVVDDDQDMRQLLKLHLGNRGYDVVVAEDAIVAGHLILEHLPDLAIVDVQLPYLSGYEFVAALKGDPETRELPVVFLTANEHFDDQAMKLGAAACLNKPLTVDRLLEVVEPLLRSPTR